MNQESSGLERPASNSAEWSVSELSGALKRTLEDAFGYVRLRGEISGYRGPHSSGHVYFSLKDQNAKIDAVIWKGSFNKIRFKPEEGLEVIATGKITTFPGKSSYQIIIDSLEPAGVGALMALLEERKRALAAEGLFAQERKRPLPYLPKVIGVVTSPTGAVIRDILHRLQDRFPRHVVVWPVRVQGEGAAEEIARAINGFNALSKTDDVPRPDVLIVARGGGAVEDLWCFNEEIVVRAAAQSTIPLISAVGHETDWTLIDYAADMRAPTPTGAAEMAVPVRVELLAAVNSLAARHAEAVCRLLDRRRSDLRSAGRALPQPEAFLSTARQRVDLAIAQLKPALVANLHSFENRLIRLQAVLQRFSPSAKLAEMSAKMNAMEGRPEQALRRLVDQKRVVLRQSAERLVAARGMTVRSEQQRIIQGHELVNRLAERLPAAAKRLVARKSDNLLAMVQLFVSLNYKSVLARGYVLVRDDQGLPVRLAHSLSYDQSITLEFADGTVQAVTNGTKQNRDTKDTPKALSSKIKPEKSGGNQGTLF